MNHSQALTQVEDMYTALGLKDRWGEALVGLEAYPPVAEFHGEAWRKLEDEFFVYGTISPAEYVRSAGAMIREFKQIQALARAKRRLIELGQDQVELDLLPARHLEAAS